MSLAPADFQIPTTARCSSTTYCKIAMFSPFIIIGAAIIIGIATLIFKILELVCNRTIHFNLLHTLKLSHFFLCTTWQKSELIIDAATDEPYLYDELIRQKCLLLFLSCASIKLIYLPLEIPA